MMQEKRGLRDVLMKRYGLSQPQAQSWRSDLRPGFSIGSMMRQRTPNPTTPVGNPVPPGAPGMTFDLPKPDMPRASDGFMAPEALSPFEGGFSGNRGGILAGLPWDKMRF